MFSDTITIKVVESGRESRSQEYWRRAFDTFCRGIVSSGAARSASVEAVFPEDPDPAMATLFTISFVPSDAGIEQSLRTLQSMPGVMVASLAPSRRPLGHRAAGSGGFHKVLMHGKRTA